MTHHNIHIGNGGKDSQALLITLTTEYLLCGRAWQPTLQDYGSAAAVAKPPLNPETETSYT